MARRTILLSEVNLTEESVNLDVSGNLAVTGTSTFTGVSSFGNGTAAAPSITFINDSATGMFLEGTSLLGFAATGAQRARIGAGYIGVFGATGSIQFGDALDVILGRDGAADTLALKNVGATPQTFRVYGDATAATLKYMNLTHDGTNAIITTSGGSFGFGTLTTSAAVGQSGITGYISIVDSAGNARRLAVVT